MASAVADRLSAPSVVVLGPGTTVRAIARRLGLPKTLLGVDVVAILADGAARVVAADAGEAAILAALDGRPAAIVVSPIGGQGFVLGRGNQQISPAVLRAAGPEALIVVATESKLASLRGQALLLDTGDAALDAQLAGYRRVIVGPGREVVVRLGIA